jgi:hypothetical protein
MKNLGIVTGAFDVHVQCFPWLNKETQRPKVVFVCFVVIKKKFEFPMGKVGKVDEKK